MAVIIQISVDVEPLSINGDYILLVMKEVLVGLFIGFMAYMMLSAVQTAGGFIDFQMGFAIANVIDPQTGAQSPLIGQYLYVFTLLLLLTVNGHHLILDGIYYSYQLIPIDQMVFALTDDHFVEFVFRSFAMMFTIAFQMAIPIVATLFLVDVALGILARTVPQLNVFVVGFPIKIAVSFIVLFIVMGVIFVTVQYLFETTLYVMKIVMEFLGGTR